MKLTPEETLLDLVKDKKQNELREFLKTYKSDIDVQEMFGWTALHLALFKNQVTIAEMLIKKGASLSIQSDDGKSPLHWAVKSNNPEEVELLLKNNAPMDIIDGYNVLAKDSTRNKSVLKIFDKYEKKRKVGKFARLLR